MRFVKEFVPDNRYQTGQRPISVETNIFIYILIKFFTLLENLFKSVRITLQNKCREVEEQTSTN